MLPRNSSVSSCFSEPDPTGGHYKNLSLCCAISQRSAVGLLCFVLKYTKRSPPCTAVKLYLIGSLNPLTSTAIDMVIYACNSTNPVNLSGFILPFSKGLCFLLLVYGANILALILLILLICSFAYQLTFSKDSYCLGARLTVFVGVTIIF
jgi:hypothetical protein